MKNALFVFSILSLFLVCSCDKKDVAPEPDFAPTYVIVKTKGSVTIREVFQLINSLGHEVSFMYSEVYTSALPPDSLSYVLTSINAKNYTNDEIWSVSGFVNAATSTITLYPKFFDMHNQTHQSDWLETMEHLRLEEQNKGYVMHFHVPAGKEKEWVTVFKTLEAVEWAELNYKADIQLL